MNRSSFKLFSFLMIGFGLFIFILKNKDDLSIRKILSKNASQNPIQSLNKKILAHSGRSNRSPSSIQLTPREKKPVILDTQRTPPDSEGNYKINKVVQDLHNYPMTRITERWRTLPDGRQVQIGSHLMAADQVLVKLSEGAAPEDLESLARNAGANIRAQLKMSGIFILEFDGKKADAIEVVLNELKKRPDIVTIGAPNFILFAQ